MVEVGAFLGGSAKTWLAAHPGLSLICIDPWQGDWWTDYARKNGREDLAKIFSEPDGPFQAFVSMVWDYRDRIIPVRGYSPAALEEIHAYGIQPDLLFLDSDKSGEDLEVWQKLFPRAQITGDDWNWGSDGSFPIQDAVTEFSDRHGYAIESRQSTWVLHPMPLSVRERVRIHASAISTRIRESAIFRKVRRRLQFRRVRRRIGALRSLIRN